jgi:uncharacterized Zn-binding protein involved in type VI secretion
VPGPAARVGDQTAHGGAITGPGAATVLIGNKPAARITDMQACPMMSGTVAHGSGVILPPGQTMVLIGNLPAATMGDTCAPPCGASIVSGDFTVLIGTSPGGVGPAIGFSAPGAAAPDPGMNPAASPSSSLESSAAQATETQTTAVVEETLTETEESEEKTLDQAKWDKDVLHNDEAIKLSVQCTNIPDGDEISFSIYEKDEDGNKRSLLRLKEKVQSNRAEVEWNFKYKDYGNVADIPTEKEQQEKDKHYFNPAFYFIASYEDLSAESDEILFKDMIKRELRDYKDEPIEDEDYVITLADGNEKKGKTDKEGKIELEDIPPGRYTIKFTNLTDSDLGKR